MHSCSKNLSQPTHFAGEEGFVRRFGARAIVSGERGRLARWFRRLAETVFMGVKRKVVDRKSGTTPAFAHDDSESFREQAARPAEVVPPGPSRELVRPADFKGRTAMRRARYRFRGARASRPSVSASRRNSLYGVKKFATPNAFGAASTRGRVRSPESPAGPFGERDINSGERGRLAPIGFTVGEAASSRKLSELASHGKAAPSPCGSSVAAVYDRRKFLNGNRSGRPTTAV
jgi:hypothetical protein